MTRRDLEGYQGLCAEIRMLEQTLTEEKARGWVSDTVKGSYPEPPYTLHSIPVGGLCKECMPSVQQIHDRLVEQKRRKQDIEAAIGSLGDRLLSVILWARYIEGKTYSQIAQMVGGGNTEENVKKKVQRFFKKSESCPECPDLT